MATIQLGNTKVANRLISYCEKRAVEREGVNTAPDIAKAQMKATREMWGKNGGVQAHHVIQSFRPDEVTPNQANEIGRELAEKIAPGHEVVVYTHDDKAHIHNHIVINSVNVEDGKKYQSSKENLYNVREESDQLCKERGLSIAKEYSAEVRYTQAEKGLIERDKYSWKDDIREKVDLEKTVSKDFEHLKENLKEKHGIDVKERGKNITFTHPDNNMKVRGSKLGNDYEKETLQREFEIQNETRARADQPSQDRGTNAIPHEYGQSERGYSAVAEEFGRQQPNDGTSERLRQHPHGQRDGRENGDPTEVGGYTRDGAARSEGASFDFERARRTLEESQRATYQTYGKWRQSDRRVQSENDSEDQQTGRSNDSTAKGGREQVPERLDRTDQHDQERTDQDTERHEEQSRPPRQQEQDYDLER